MFIVLDDLIGRTVLWAWGLPYAVQVVMLVFLAAWAALLLHELAHGFVALVLGIGALSVTLGAGPVLYRGHIGGCSVRLALLPLHGEVRFRDDDARVLGYQNVGREDWTFEWRTGSWRAPLISAAGGVANLLAAAAIVAYWLWMPRLTPPSFALFSMCLIVNLMMFLNLMPIRGLDGGRLVVHAAAFRHQGAGQG